ncbi:hypothetical protein HZC30_08295 [Candidatus Woesearchaeota archaeon]|nr:hypothetical protein [Candidatus Woesearchaeota archaeon]
MTDEDITKVKKKFRRIYKYSAAAGTVILGGVISTIATCEKAPTVVRGIVLEEKYVPSKEKSVPPGEKEAPAPLKYMLNLKVYEPTKNGEKERLCTFYIKEDPEMPSAPGMPMTPSMPIAVLDEVISAGSEVYIHYFGKGLTLHTKEPLYKIGCFGAALSSEIKVVHPWESSEVVKKTLEDKLESIRQKEVERIIAESNEYELAKKVF